MGEEEEASGLEGKGDLTPWEQHSAVINIPRYDYKAPSSLLDHQHSGFLITCTIKREKSATKEAIKILKKYVGASICDTIEKVEPSDTNGSSKKRKVCTTEKIDKANAKNAESDEATNIAGTSGEVANGTSLSSTKTEDHSRGSILSLVKLTRSGLLLFTFPSNNHQQTVDILSDIFHSLSCGNLKPPVWCHRILPIQATCNLNEKDLHIVVSKLIQRYFNDEHHKLEKPLKFAVGYNRRGIEETVMKIRKSTAKDSTGLPLLDKNECFRVVAAAVKDSVPESVVDLKSPKKKKICYNVVPWEPDIETCDIFSETKILGAIEKNAVTEMGESS